MDCSLCHQRTTSITATAADPFTTPSAERNDDAVTDSLSPSISFDVPSHPSLFSHRLALQIVFAKITALLAKMTAFLAIASYAVGSRLERLALSAEFARLEALPPPGAEDDCLIEPIAEEDNWIERITACFVARWFFVWLLNTEAKAHLVRHSSVWCRLVAQHPNKVCRRLGKTKAKALERFETARAPRRWAKFRLNIVYTRVQVRRTRAM